MSAREDAIKEAERLREEAKLMQDAYYEAKRDGQPPEVCQAWHRSFYDAIEAAAYVERSIRGIAPLAEWDKYASSD